MRRAFALARLLILALVLITSGSTTAEAAETETLEISVDVGSFPEVVATVSLPDALADTELSPADFTIIENGRRRRATITPLRSEAVPVVVVIDTSGSMQGAPMEQAKAAAAAFVGQLPPAWPIGVVGFGPRPALLAPLTVDRQAIGAAIGALAARGETALYDAVAMTGERLAADGVRRATVVLLSDGGDTVSTIRLDDAVARLGPGIRLEIVELASPESDHGALERLAAARHGRVTSVGDAAGLSAVYDALGRSLRSQYVVRYASGATEPSEFSISVAKGAVRATGRARFEPPPLPTPDVPARSTPHTRTSPEPMDERGWLLAAGAASFFLAMALGSLMVSLPTRRFAVLGAMTRRRGRHQSEMLSDLASRAVAAADSALEQRGRRSVLNDTLEQAGIALRAGEFLVLVCSAAAAAFVLVALLVGPMVGMLGAALVALGFRLRIGMLVERRRKDFAEQLPDTVQMLSGALRAGYALVQAIDSVANEAPSPSSEELHRIVVETRLGRDLTESLRAASSRVGSQDFDWVVQAIEIQREVGGDLAEVLDTVAGTIRERMQLFRHVRALTAEGRMSAYVLLGLPPVLALALSVINPDYFAELTRGLGLAMAGAGIVLMGVGALWFKKLCRLQF